MADWGHIYVVPGHQSASGEWCGTELRCEQHSQWRADADFTVMDAAFQLAGEHIEPHQPPSRQPGRATGSNADGAR